MEIEETYTLISI